MIQNWFSLLKIGYFEKNDILVITRFKIGSAFLKLDIFEKVVGLLLRDSKLVQPLKNGYF